MGDKEIDKFDKKTIVDGGHGEQRPFSSERNKPGLERMKK